MTNKTKTISFGQAQDLYVNCGPSHKLYGMAVEFFSREGWEKSKEAHDKLASTIGWAA